jgi:hypothetical protein
VLDVRRKNRRSRLLIEVKRVGIARLVVDWVGVVRSFVMGYVWKGRRLEMLVAVLEWSLGGTKVCFF